MLLINEASSADEGYEEKVVETIKHVFMRTSPYNYLLTRLQVRSIPYNQSPRVERTKHASRIELSVYKYVLIRFI